MTFNQRTVNLILGPILFLCFSFFLPESIFETFASRATIGTVAWMAYWWVTGPIDLAITSFLPIAVNSLLMIADMSKLIANYSSKIILLLLGASIITVLWEETGLGRRIALKSLSFIGNKLRSQLVFWFLLSALFSTIVNNTIATATIIPIAVALLHYIGVEDIGTNRIGSKLLTTIVFAVGIGGLASPLGGAMNLVTVEYIQQLTGQEYFYLDWVIYFLPVMLVLFVSNILFLLRDVKKDEIIGHSKEFFVAEYNKLPKMSGNEKIALSLLIIPVLLSFTRQFYKDLLPGLEPAYSFIICAILTFLIAGKDGKPVMRWNSVKNKIVWQLMFLFGGGLAAGSLIIDSGAAEAIGEAISLLNMNSNIFLIVIFIAFPMLLANFTSNTATAAITIPIVISIVNGLGQNPIPYIYISTIGVNLAYMFPTSIRSIPVAYGLSTTYLLKEGWKISLLMLVLMLLCGYILLKTNYMMEGLI